MRTATFAQPILIMAVLIAIFKKITAMPLLAALPISYLQVAVATAAAAIYFCFNIKVYLREEKMFKPTTILEFILHHFICIFSLTYIIIDSFIANLRYSLRFIFWWFQ